MKFPPLMLCLVLLGSFSVGHAEDAPPLSAAILDFKEADPALEGMGASVASLLQVKLSAMSSAILVERAELHEVLAEHELTLSDAVSPGQAAKVGQLTGAEAIISGRVFQVQDRTYLVAKVISTSSGRVFGATTDFQKGGPLDGAVGTLAEKVAVFLKDKVLELRGEKPLEERQLEALKAKMKDRVAPKFFVWVKEAVIQGPAPDPAAQTELSRTLQKAGWTLVENEDEADVIIQGEAFAEIGVRRGNLWFTRARLEYTVKNHERKILLTDRVVAGNVDLAQLISGKGALQKTGLLASTATADAWISSLGEKH
jgi:hypothetical protein